MRQDTKKVYGFYLSNKDSVVGDVRGMRASLLQDYEKFKQDHTGLICSLPVIVGGEKVVGKGYWMSLKFDTWRKSDALESW